MTGEDRPARRAIDHACFGLLPLLATAFLLFYVYSGPRFFAVDFRYAYLGAGSHVLHGLSPYRPSARLIAGGEAFVYPAAAALLFMPFALIGHGIAAVLFTAICLASLLATLGVLGVRDWRVYGAALLFEPVVAGWQTGNLTLLIGLGLALAWRFRDRPLLAGVVIAILVSLKPFVWPVALWLLVTRRYAAAGWAALVGVALNLAVWGVVGFGQIARFLHVSSETTKALWNTGYGLVALVTGLGGSHTAGLVIMIIATVIAAWAMVRAGRGGDDAVALTFGVVAMLVASPLAWSHYFALLIVPIAILRPRLSGLWLAPLLLWVCPTSAASTWQAAVWWLVVAGVTLELVRRPLARRAQLGSLAGVPA